MVEKRRSGKESTEEKGEKEKKVRENVTEESREMF